MKQHLGRGRSEPGSFPNRRSPPLHVLIQSNAAFVLALQLHTTAAAADPYFRTPRSILSLGLKRAAAVSHAHCPSPPKEEKWRVEESGRRRASQYLMRGACSSRGEEERPPPTRASYDLQPKMHLLTEYGSASRVESATKGALFSAYPCAKFRDERFFCPSGVKCSL